MPNSNESTTIVVIDTSILVQYLRIPGFGNDDEFENILIKFNEKRASNETLMLPMATIFETGNHIGQIANGEKKRNIAKLFVELIIQALNEEEPFTIMNFLEAEKFKLWIIDFPNRVNEMGLGDLSIVKDYEDLCLLHKRKKVYIWSLDTHLQGNIREPETK